MTYHQSPAISRGHLLTASHSWEEYYARYIMRSLPAKDLTQSMSIGLLAHSALLESHTVQEKYVIQPTAIKRRAGKIWELFRTKNQNKTILTVDEFQTAILSAASLRRSLEDGFKAAVGSTVETPIYWVDKETGLECRALPDLVLHLPDGSVLIIDIKTTGKPMTIGSFVRSSKDFGYHVQESHYRAGWEATRPEPIKGFIFACVETFGIYRTKLFQFDEPTIDLTNQRRRELLNEIAKRSASNDWSDAGVNEINMISLEV